MREQHFGFLVIPPPKVVKNVVEAIAIKSGTRKAGCPSPWEGHFTLGELASALLKQKYTPEGIQIEISKQASEVLLTGYNTPIPIGTYIIKGPPFTLINGGVKQHESISVYPENNTNQLFRVPTDPNVFKLAK